MLFVQCKTIISCVQRKPTVVASGGANVTFSSQYVSYLEMHQSALSLFSHWTGTSVCKKVKDGKVNFEDTEDSGTFAVLPLCSIVLKQEEQ